MLALGTSDKYNCYHLASETKRKKNKIKDCLSIYMGRTISSADRACQKFLKKKFELNVALTLG
jgi:hypothetical protein